MEECEGQIVELKIEYNKKLIEKLEDKNGDKRVIEKYRRNIEHYITMLSHIQQTER